MADILYYEVVPPRKWQAGTMGANQTPLFFGCADCGEKDAEIAGMASIDGTFRGIGIIRTVGHFFGNPALFCRTCFAKRIAPPKVGVVVEGVTCG